MFSYDKYAGPLKPGTVVKIPGYETKTYNAKKGETISSLSEKFSVPIDLLHLLNDENMEKKGSIWSIPEKRRNFVFSGKKEYTSLELEKDIQRLLEAYPFIVCETIGQSVMGKPIYMLTVGTGPKKIHINASFHGNEWITTGILMDFIHHYVTASVFNDDVAGINARKLMEEVTLYAVPMVDPDGVDLVLNGPPDHPEYGANALKLNGDSLDFSSWKANIRGVDLNNQFPALWEIEKARKPKYPAPRDYPGSHPLSEPEAAALAEAADRCQFDRVIALHTQGQEIYWGFEGREPPESEPIVRQMEAASGYKAIRYLDSYAGYKDWFIYKYRKAGFTVELGLGVNPLPLTQYEEIYEQSLGIFLAGMMM
jgi:g-D-glutamyl-meso-diaminopimelate peptidase